MRKKKNAEPTESFRVALSAPTGGVTIGGDNTATVYVFDDDGPGGLVQFTGDVTVREDAGTALLTVALAKPATTPVTVSYGTSDSSAKAGSDYTTTSGTLSFGIGEQTKTISVPIIDDKIAEPTKTLGVSLFSPTGGVVIGSRTWCVVTILDND